MHATGSLKMMNYAGTEIYLLSLLSHCLLIKFHDLNLFYHFEHVDQQSESLEGKYLGKMDL